MLSVSQVERNAFNALASVVQNAGIELNLNKRDPKCEALAFIASEHCDQRSLKRKKSFADLIDEVNRLAKEKEGEAACEVAWKLDQEVQSLMGRKIKRLAYHPAYVHNQTLLQAINKLYVTCKRDHFNRYQKGEVVNFAGVPKDFVPAWYRDINA